MRTLLFCVVLAAAACADLRDMRATDPVRAGRFAGHWRAVAECIDLRLDGRVLYDAPHETALVGDVPQNNMLGNKFAYYERESARSSREYRNLLDRRGSLRRIQVRMPVETDESMPPHE